MTDHQENFENNNFENNNMDNVVQSVKGAMDDAHNMKEKVSKRAVALKEKLSDQTYSLRDRLSEQACTYGNQIADSIDNARGKTSAGLRDTSERIQSLAMYVEEHDARNMSKQLVDHTSQYISRHPGRTMIVGLVLGLLVGRAFGMFQPGKKHCG